MQILKRCQIWWTLLIVSVAMLVRNTCGIQWLGLYNNRHQTEHLQQDKEYCSRMQRLNVFNQRQTRFCKKHFVADPGAVSALIESAKKIVDSCQFQFKHYRWNCHVLSSLPEVAPELKSLTAEQAFVYALSGLILTTTFADECAKGTIRRCSCGSEPTWLRKERPTWQFKFEGCHTNLKMGQRLARRFLAIGKKNKRHQQRSTEADRSGPEVIYQNYLNFVNSYNYDVGIEAAQHMEAVRCKCHGSSASCTLRTCHKILHNKAHHQLETTYFRKSNIDGMELVRDMYENNLRKTVFDETGYQGYEEPCTPEEQISNPLRKEPRCDFFKTVIGTPKHDALLFQDYSLDYCNVRDEKFNGTLDRECLPDSTLKAQNILKTESYGNKEREIVCSVMCCGRTHRNVTVTYEGTHAECQAVSCRLLSNPFRVVCTPCQLDKSYCN